MTPRIGQDFVDWTSPTVGDDRTLGRVDFSRWAAKIAGPAYAIDDDTAVKVTDGTVEVVSDGHWKLFIPDS
ncbi:hypothetical protein ACFY0B_16730 [Streptomyces sp. NPDC001797]|uniref:hypothetical protein n=1 Tax=Streptomyces sp. NPDC001797 TaxID=3364610 RepID=UPI0036767EBF